MPRAGNSARVRVWLPQYSAVDYRDIWSHSADAVALVVNYSRIDTFHYMRGVDGRRRVADYRARALALRLALVSSHHRSFDDDA